MSYVLGIDPGTQGGLALLKRGRAVELVSLKKLSDRDIADIFQDWSLYNIVAAAIEGVHSMPGEGVSSVFKFGKATGFLHGQLAAFRMPYVEIQPQVWQRRLGLGKKYPSRPERKRAHKAKAQQMYPAEHITLENCDALLIAEVLYRDTFTSRTN